MMEAFPEENSTYRFTYKNSIYYVEMFHFRLWYDDFIREINFYIWIFRLTNRKLLECLCTVTETWMTSF